LTVRGSWRAWHPLDEDRLVRGSAATHVAPCAGGGTSTVKSIAIWNAWASAQLSSRFRRLESAVNPKSTTEQLPEHEQDAAFDAAFSPAALDAEYEDLLRSHHDAFTDAPRIATGSDRLTRTQFERQRTQHFTAASRQVLRGDYKFSGFLEREIPKDDTGDVRTISVAKIRDVVVQKALYGYLYDAVDARLSDSVFGYRKGRSAHDAVQAIEEHFKAGRVCVFDADLKGFFGRRGASAERLGSQARRATRPRTAPGTPPRAGRSACLRAAFSAAS
jgi:hypothetical protein